MELEEMELSILDENKTKARSEILKEQKYSIIHNKK